MKQVKRRKVRVVGTVRQRDTGRAEVVYGRKCKYDDVEHEVMVAELEVILKRRIERAAKVGRTEADGVIDCDGRKAFVELDNSAKLTAKQYRRKWSLFSGVAAGAPGAGAGAPPVPAGVDCFVLVVATSEGRMNKLMAWAEPVRDIALFTTFERLRAGKPWVDKDGKTVTI